MSKILFPTLATILVYSCEISKLDVPKSGADPGLSVRGDEIWQGDLRVLIIIIVSYVYGTYMYIQEIR